MKKVMLTLMCLAAMLAAGIGLRAQEVTITLNPGWNWISYPNAVSMEIGEALGDFVPMNGDRITSQFNSSSYVNGHWRGSITQFMPGLGYMYYSTRTETTSFVFTQAFSTVVTTTDPIYVITSESAVVRGTVTVPEGGYVFLRGVCWGTEPNPGLDGNHTSEETGIGMFTSTIEGLSPYTAYYVRAYAVTNNGLVYGNELNFITPGNDSEVIYGYVDLGLPSGLLWAVCNVGAATPEEYGGYFAWGETQTKDTYNWSTYQFGNGSYQQLTKYCNNANYGYNGFTDDLTTLLPEDDAATANWGSDWRMPNKEEWEELFQNTTLSWTSQNGVAGRLFTASNGNSIFLPATGYRNENAMENVGSYGYYWSSSLDTSNPLDAWEFYLHSQSYNTYSNYRRFGFCIRPVCPPAQNNVPQGAVNGLFSVSDSEQVYFSQGNLMYQASTNTWKFADHQWDYVGTQNPYAGNPGGNISGSDNSGISSTYSGWIDLFGWGTSGYNHGAVCYQPWSTSTTDSHYYAYGQYFYHLYDMTGQADWGYNPISNGGNQPNQWRTPTKDEWGYLFNSRNTVSGIRYAMARVNNVNGIILLPDNWSPEIYNLNNTNSPNSYSSNILTASEWGVLEQAGAIFLPAGGSREGNLAKNVGDIGHYWAASYFSNSSAYYLLFRDTHLTPQYNYDRFRGRCVRVVHSADVLLYSINATSIPAEGGSITGQGNYGQDATCTLTATPNEGYTFIDWTENGAEVSTEATYTFTVSGDRFLVANFALQSTGAPTGAVGGMFSVSDSEQVYFSRGNLMYQASTNTWKFADHQWDFVGTQNPYSGTPGGTVSGSDNNDISSTYSGWIDHFGWGTSGYNHGAVCYQPWSTSQTDSHYYAYGQPSYHLYDWTGQADWGYNPISNGGNQPHQWRTLTKDEWNYLFYSRSTASGKLFAMARVNNVNGIILLPDDWSSDIYNLNNTNSVAHYNSNVLTVSQWIVLEQAGAVFLPAGGNREGTSSGYVGENGHYWAASYYSNTSAYYLLFRDAYLNSQYNYDRFRGRCVRVVRSVNMCSINATANPTEGGMVTGQGNYELDATCTLEATPTDGYNFINWSENGEVVSLEPTYSFTVTCDRALVANFRSQSQAPIGAVNGVFSVSDSQQVYFSQGNLQYIGSASTPYWKFADYQWDCLGSATGQNSSNQSVDRDLFGWGTSGYDHGAICYQPWSTSGLNSNYYAYGSANYSLYDQTGQADWGYNPISNGGNQENQWRTLTMDEWLYVLYNRNTASGIRYAKANVSGVNGLILLPDEWNATVYSLNNTNQTGASFVSNVITSTDWSVLEEFGAVFLPSTGERNSTSVNYEGIEGVYWSSNCQGNYYIWFNDSSLTQYGVGHYFGLGVRLVSDIIPEHPME